ncbi:uncharacterized protein At2g02148 isoform X2 [Impatiens glandulifera]|uniref:uncharacterized protein At2g02148 isoform X2 n=1 Tax=Impatiens glandulifera TaxID=253017 RepID=UPI001FB12A70|nr:uncharacterized protein At2g02148 isoform X2 [Impatiens glandulifera]
METRVPVQHYNLRSANSYTTGTSLHDLNTVDDRSGEMECIRDGVSDGSLDNNEEEEESSAVNCLHEPYRDSLTNHDVGGVKEDRQIIENNESSSCSYDNLTAEDVLPIESARARFLDIVVDNFISSHLLEVPDSEVVDYSSVSAQDKLGKRKPREIHYEGDARFVLPLMYVANMYETLVNEVNTRLTSVNEFRGKNIGVALEAAGGLYRKLTKKFPKKGTCTYKRRELATSLETRSRFPELVVQEEKRVRFVVVNGLSIVDKPMNISQVDSEWFKRLTGRNEVAISDRDFKFYSPRHKYRRVSSSPSLPTFGGTENSSPMASSQGYRSVNDQTPSKHQIQRHSQFHSMNPTAAPASHFVHHNHQCVAPNHLTDVPHAQQSSPPSISHHNIACLQQLPQAGNRMHMLTSPAKFCDECGAPYLRETSKFCSECGVKRLGT